LTLRKAAERAGVTFGFLRVALSRGFPRRGLGWRLEAALSYRHAIWTDSRALADRARCVRAFGIDPYLVSRPALEKMVRLHGFNFSGCQVKADFVRAVFERATAVGRRASVQQNINN
jgi:hypothetical protein